MAFRYPLVKHSAQRVSIGSEVNGHVLQGSAFMQPQILPQLGKYHGAAPAIFRGIVPTLLLLPR